MQEIGKFSKKDTLNYPVYVERLDEIVDIINPIIDSAPPQSLMDSLKIGLKLKKPKKQSITEVYQMMTAPVATVLD